METILPLAEKKSLENDRLKRKSIMSLRWKATLFAVAIVTLPLVGVGTVSYRIAAFNLEKQIQEAKKFDTLAAIAKVEHFLSERYRDVRVLAHLSILTDKEFQRTTTPAQRQKELTEYARAKQIYDSIAFSDLNGDDIIVSEGTIPGKHQDKDYFKQALQSQKGYISQPVLDKLTGETYIYFSSVVRDSLSKEIVGVVRSRMPVRHFDNLLAEYSVDGSTYHLADKVGNVFVTNDVLGRGELASEHLKEFFALRQAGKTAVVEAYEETENRNVVGAYAKIRPIEGLPDLGWDGFLVTDLRVAYAAEYQLTQTLVFGTIFAAVAIAVLAAVIASKAVAPIERAAEAVNKIGHGNLKVRLSESGSDELATLATNINAMANQIQQLLEDSQNKAVELQAQKDLIARESELLQADISHILDVVSALEAGDLSAYARVNERVTGLVSDLINRLIEKLVSILSVVLSTAELVMQKAQELEDIAVVSAERVQQQTQAVMEVQSLMTNVNYLSQNAARQALEADEAMLQAKEAVGQGQQELSAMSVGIGNLGEAKEEILRRVQTLSDFIELTNQFSKDQKRLATQTRVLALNASMLATRASEQQDPENFSSVAKEFQTIAKQVNDLAVQTNQSLIVLKQRSEQIQTVGSGIDRDVQEISKLIDEFTLKVERSQQAFDEIGEVTEQVAQIEKQVSESNQSIARAAQTTLQSIQQIAAVATDTEQKADLTREQSGSIGQMTYELLKQIRFFQISNPNRSQSSQNSSETQKLP